MALSRKFVIPAFFRNGWIVRRRDILSRVSGEVSILVYLVLILSGGRLRTSYRT